MSYQELKSPPIVESIFYIRLKDQIDKQSIIDFCESGYIQEQYHINNPSFKHFEQKGDDSAFRSEQYGRVLRSLSKDRALRVNLDSVSYHCLSYGPFDNLYREFDNVIKNLAKFTKGLCIDRISLRYINLIKVNESEDCFKVDDYVTTYIESPFDLQNYFLQISVVDQEDKSNVGFITQALKFDKETDVLEGMTIDIQVQKNIDISYEENAWKSLFFSLRKYKNHLFFSTIQPKILETYQ